MDTLRALPVLYLKLTPELKEIQISPIQGHAYIMQLQVVFIMKYPQDWFHYLGKVRVRASAACGVLLKAETAQRRVGSDTKLKTPPYSIAGTGTE